MHISPVPLEALVTDIKRSLQQLEHDEDMASRDSPPRWREVTQDSFLTLLSY